MLTVSVRAILRRLFLLTTIAIVLQGSFAHAQFSEQLYIDAFKAQDYQSLFAQAILYRQTNNIFTGKVEKETYDNVLSLELISLSKHCQWQIVRDLLDSHKALVEANQLPVTKKVGNQIGLKKEFKKYSSDVLKKRKSILTKLKERRDQWKLAKNSSQAFTNQKKLLVNLESKCKK